MIKKIKNYDEWQRRFYEAYESKDYELAAEIYKSWFDFHERTPDVHAGYKLQKQGDTKKVLVTIAVLLIFVLIFYLMYS